MPVITAQSSSAYFPPLDKCLAGDDHLISWETAWRALCDQNAAADNTSLEAFLTDPQSVNFLANALDPFLQPAGKTKSDFETKTAPVNVSQSNNGEYHLDELKKDALWLSQAVGLEELVALRVCIIEWQQRSEDGLIAATTGNGALVSADLGASSFRASSFRLSTSFNGASKPTSNFDKEEVRRQRQLQLYLEERSCILRISTDLVNRVAVNAPSQTSKTWIDNLAEKVAEDMQCSHRTTAAGHNAFLMSCIDMVDKTIQKLDDKSKWPDAFQKDDATQLLFVSSTFMDITTALRLTLANLHIQHSIPNADIMLAWYKLMGKVSFFQDLAPSPALPDTSTLQCLASIVSVTILRITEVLNRIQESAMPLLEESSVQYPQLECGLYFQNEACIREINLMMYGAARANIAVAGPAIYGWSILTSSIRDVANLFQDQRDQLRDGDDREENGSSPSLRRRASRRESSREEMTAFEKQYYQIQDPELENEARDDPPAFYAKISVDAMGVYAVIAQLSMAITTAFGSKVDEATSYIGRSTLFELVQEAMAMVKYDGDILEAILAILTPEVHGRATEFDARLADRFVSSSSDQGNGTFRQTVLEQALARYPFELSPLLRLLTGLSSASSSRPAGPTDVVQLLESLSSLTVMMPETFRDYALDNEDESMNNIVLTQSLPLFMSKQALSYHGNDHMGRAALTMGSGEADKSSNVLAIPTSAPGIVVKENRPLVFRLEHQHSALEYLGLLLSTLLPNAELLVAPTKQMELDRSTAADIIVLVTSLLKSSLHQNQGAEEARFILGRLAYALNEEQDIISVVADILETELLAHLDQSIAEGSLELLVACAEFFDILAGISPERVWSTLAQSSLLALSGGANALAAVVGGTEVPIARYRFLTACVKMYAHLIDDAIAGLVKRRTKVNKSANRFDSPMSPQDTTPERTMSSVLSAYQTVMVDAWQSLGEWQFAVRSEKSEVSTLILKSFERLLRSTYGVRAEGKEGISAPLLPAAKILMDSIAPSDGNGTGLRSFAQLFAAGTSASDMALTTQERAGMIADVDAAAEFLTTLLRTTRSHDQSSKSTYALGTQLVKMMSPFATLMATDHAYKRSLANLLSDVVKAVNIGHSGSDQRSLLGQLNAEAAKSFLAVISQLDRPLRDIDVECSIWTFLSSVMTSTQQWFAIYLLTGSIPKDRLKQEDKNNKSSKSLLVYALDQLANIASLPPERAIHMLNFVASAQKAWVWATNEVRSHSDFLKNTLEWLNGLQPPSRAPNVAEEIILSNEHQMAAHLCDILAVNLNAGIETDRANENATVLKFLVPKLAFLRDHAGSVDAYNRSLHRNLADNFMRKFSGCEVGDFTRTSCNTAPFGRQFYYDLNLANRVLGHNAAWQGAGLSVRNQGFAEEFARANVNLSLVQAQKSLLHSWRALATTLCECVDQDSALKPELAKTAERSLRANAVANLDVPGMDEVVTVRVEMAFVILSKLVAVKADSKEMKSLLSATWDLGRASPVDYDVATAAEDLRYYRTLLQVLYLSIQPHVYIDTGAATANGTRAVSATDETQHKFLDPTIAAILVEIVGKTIASGFRALCGNLHTSIALAQPADFTLLTGILRALLSVKGVEAVHPQISDIIASTSLVRGALSLYSWSDKLTSQMDDEEDPIYGEVAITFLLTLSTIPAVAEQMAGSDTALVQISSANLSDYFRKLGGKGPFDEPRRMFQIWTQGLLPLCLNLLDAVGPPLAAGISSFLNGFPEQLKRAESALENRAATARFPHAGAVTLSLVSEAHSLCLIARILASDVACGAAAGINAADVPKLDFDHEKVKEDAGALIRQKTSLASRIVPLGAMEERLKATGGNESLLMGRVVGEVMGLLRCFGEEDGEKS